MEQNPSLHPRSFFVGSVFYLSIKELVEKVNFVKANVRELKNVFSMWINLPFLINSGSNCRRRRRGWETTLHSRGFAEAMDVSH